MLLACEIPLVISHPEWASETCRSRVTPWSCAYRMAPFLVQEVIMNEVIAGVFKEGATLFGQLGRIKKGQWSIDFQRKMTAVGRCERHVVKPACGIVRPLSIIKRERVARILLLSESRTGVFFWTFQLLQYVKLTAAPAHTHAHTHTFALWD